jgi:type I restriction enzyme S subunit
MEIELKKLGEITTGNTPSKKDEKYWDSADICFVKPDGIADEGITLISDSSEYISENARGKARVVSKDAVFVTCIGSIGKVGIADYGDYAFNQQINVIEPNEKVLPRYLAYNLLYSKPRLVAIANAPVVPIINKTQFGEFIVNIEEDRTKQAKIISVLDKLTGIIDSREKELESFDELIKARFVELFGDPVSNSKELPIATLPELGEFGRGVSKHRPRNDPKLLGGDYPLIQTGDVAAAELYITDYSATYSELGLKQSKMWDKGTLCITIAANIAKTAILTFDACFPDSVVGFMANERTSNIFIHYWFSFFQAILESQAPESAQKNINLKILSELKVINPSKEEQVEFEEFVKQVDKSKVVVQKALNETQTLFDSLMQEYFG